MNGRNTKLGGLLGLTLAVSALGMAGCEGTDGGSDGGGILGNLAEQCGLTCPADGRGVAYGNASVTGYAGIDTFFQSVVNFSNVSAGVSADIDAELVGIQSLFGITDMERRASASLGAAISAKLQANYKASVVVNAKPAKCSVDAQVTAQATAKCQAEANCTADPGSAKLQCMGTCTVDANVSGSCDANATLRCNVTAPDFECRGECSGTCYADLTVAGTCSGTCNGTCSGTCMGDTDSGGNCRGTCMGMCQGRCELAANASAGCMAKCDGSCEYTPAMGGCDARAEVSCDLNAQASAECSGRCEGEFIPPKVQCDASASCEASAKAEAKFQVQCTPPSVDVRVVAQAGFTAQAQVDFLIGQLKLRLPRLAAATARAKLASEASADLLASGRTAVQTTVTNVASAKLDFITTAKIGRCVPAQLNESQRVIASANEQLNKRLSDASSVATTFGMAM